METQLSRYKVFLSHNHKQSTWVSAFYNLLESAGMLVFFDDTGVLPGDNIINVLSAAVEDSEIVLLIVTGDSLSSPWVALECSVALYGSINGKKRVVPVLLEAVDRNMWPPPIRVLNAVDLSNPFTREREFSRLLHFLGMSQGNHRCPEIRATTVQDYAASEEELRIGTIEDILSWGWDGKRLLDDLIRLDYETIDGLTAAHEGQTDQWAPVFMDHPDTWRLLYSRPEQILGYWHFVPLFEEEYDLAISGKLLDCEITTDRVRVFELPGSYDVYVVSICLIAAMRRTRAFKVLMESFADLLTELAREGVFVRRVCANAYSPSGISLSKSIGLQYETDHADHGRIYAGSIRAVLCHPFLSRKTELTGLYENS